MPFSSRRNELLERNPNGPADQPQFQHVQTPLPDSYLLTKDWGTPSREASSIWVNPAWTRALRSRPRNRSFSAE